MKPREVVLLYSPVKSRIHWPFGIVTELLTGSDGKTRSVRVRRADKSHEVYSVNHVYPLEIQSNMVSPPTKHVENKPAANRPRRKAAVKFLEKNKDYISRAIVNCTLSCSGMCKNFSLI